MMNGWQDESHEEVLLPSFFEDDDIEQRWVSRDSRLDLCLLLLLLFFFFSLIFPF